jgi:tetratricopeptide (TPR) repeat protein
MNGILLVTRLDAATPEIARGLVDKALQAERDGLWGRAYFDVRNITDPGYKIGDDWIRGASQFAQQAGFDTVVDENSDTFPAGFPMSQIAFYAGWYRENQSGPFTLPKVEFMPGAFAYHLHSYSAASLRATNHNWTGPLLAQGATCTFGSVDEPYLNGTPDVAGFTGRWMFLGFTFGEAAYAAQTVLSWQTTVVGDPLYSPFKRPLLDQHRELLEHTNKLAEWSTIRLVNASRNRGIGLAELSLALETAEQTKDSAVLSEKLAELYVAQGKPASAILLYERALKLDPTPQQRVRLRLTLGEKLIAVSRKDEARANYQSLLAEMPAYADAEVIRQKITALEVKPPGQANEATSPR